MRELFEIDLLDYDSCNKEFYRPSSRAIILMDGKIALVYSKRDHYYKFPGGGINNNESKIEALIREVKEEAGLTVIPSSIKEFGSVKRKQRGKDDTIFIQENFYYFCECENNIGSQNLDQYELEAGFVLRIVDIDLAIKENEAFHSNNLFDQVMIKREEKVLRLIKDYLKL